MKWPVERKVDYLDGYSSGPYQWLVSIYIWKWHFILGHMGRYW